MAYLVAADNYVDGWLGAVRLLADQPDGKAVNLNVAFPADGAVDREVESNLDEFYVEHDVRTEDRELVTVRTVANTLFPSALYRPELGDGAAERLYENYALSMQLHQRRARDKDTYFNRLVAYPVDGEPWNQLGYYIDRLRTQRETLRRSSSYELGVSHPGDADLRIQAPFKDKRMGSFPCLSHVSLTLAQDQVHMTATYRNQTFVTRAFGNYQGLSNLLRFIASETGAKPGEIQVVATHADVEFTRGKRVVRDLIRRCGDGQLGEFSVAGSSEAATLAAAISPRANVHGAVARVGIDAVHVPTWSRHLVLGGAILRDRIYRVEELRFCADRADRLANRLAAKEAVLKVLGTGIRGVALKDVEVISLPCGRPTVHLHAAASRVAEELQLQRVELSLCHEGEFAFALAAGVAGGPDE